MGFWSRKSSPPPTSQRGGVNSKHQPAPKKTAPPPPSPPKPKSKSKPKPRPGRIIIHFVRHAEGYNNLRTPGAGNLTDPLLTPHGKSQCLTLRTQFSRLKPQHILCSPLRRTLQTALLSLPRTRIPITVDPELREYGSVPNCTGTPIGELKRKHEGVKMGFEIDFERVNEGWERNRERDGGYVGGRWRRSREQRERSVRVLERLWELGRERLEKKEGDVEILVISHGEFLHGLTGDYWHNADIISLTMIKTYRGYGFVDPPIRFAYY
ncbi:uncharacterized protein EAF01_009898 [Botrytis porri]|uniref:Uncharacterized protein n=1 Tax=Botrytis porri TaxID=87229 RepID=A0A4Z1K634_9HELO|nr:uncharacterized protein EAF01_009898 [Botrytis porri]KAF7894447.1 hypothetical protein EAF01_009898 [Botrytis porri]TGO81395.1 hypothetical protein BPOR_1173g00010 [Botrytis porri]